MRRRLVRAVVGTRGCRQQLARVKPLPFEHRATPAWVAVICPRCREQTTLPGPLFTTGLTATARPCERIEIPAKRSADPMVYWSARSDGPPGGRNGAFASVGFRVLVKREFEAPARRSQRAHSRRSALPVRPAAACDRTRRVAS